MQGNILQQGADLMIFGMGTVFVFLTLAVLCVYAMSKIITIFFAEAEPLVVKPAATATSSRTMKAADPRILAAIQKAIYQHRGKKN